MIPEQDTDSNNFIPKDTIFITGIVSGMAQKHKYFNAFPVLVPQKQTQPNIHNHTHTHTHSTLYKPRETSYFWDSGLVPAAKPLPNADATIA